MDSATTTAPRSEAAPAPGVRPVALLIIVAYAIACTAPAIWNGSVFGDDSLSHLVMSRHFTDQLWSGDFYPRWLADANAGLGSQVFHFYGPVSYYITAMFRPIVGVDPEGWHQLGLSAALAVAVSGCTCYWWLRETHSETAALVAAVLYISAPYHLAIDLYQRFALGELWAFAWMPLILRQAGRASAAWRDIPMLAAPYALLVMTHLPATLLFSALPPVYAAWRAPPGARLRMLLGVAGAMALGIGMSAAYLLPAMGTQAHVRIDELFSGHFDLASHFLYRDDYPTAVIRNVSERAGLFTALVVVAAVGAWLLAMGRADAPTRRENAFWIVVTAIAFFMMLAPSKPVWDAIPRLSNVQFPWRFNLVLTVAATALIAGCLTTLGRAPSPWRVIALAIPCAAMVLTAVIGAAVSIAVARELGAPALDKLVRVFGDTHPDLKLRLEATSLSRYDSFLPRWIAPDLFALTPEALARIAALGGDPRHGRIVQGSGSMRVTQWEPERIRLQADSSTGLSVDVHQFHYPGWEARIAGTNRVLSVEPSAPEGLLRIAIPAGAHEVLVTLEPTPIERAGQWVSAASLGLAAFLAMRRSRRSATDRSTR